MDRDPFDLVGDTLDGQFRVVSFAGEGDLSVVYKGHHIGVDAPVAIKCLDLPTTLDGALVRPLVESFREASRLHYRLARGNLNIAQSIASGSTLAPATGMIVPYLVREWFEGESLGAELVRRRGEGKKGRSVDEVVALLDPAVDAVAYAHAQGALHLSINPSNLFLAERAGKRSLKVLDFGVSRVMNDLAQEIPPESRPAGLRVLFPAYAAPEQLDTTVGKLGAWTDVYALALLMMELLSDRVVMAGQRRPTPRTHGLELPRNLDLVLTRAVARAPGRRQKNATDFWNDTKTSLRGATSRGMSAARAPSKPTSTAVGTAPPSSPAVVGAVPGKRLRMPSVPSLETIPMGFHPGTPTGPTYVPLPLPAVEAKQEDLDQPPVHVVATPPPPQAATPALPPVIVAMDTPLPLPAPPPPPPPPPPEPLPPPLPRRMPQSPTFPIIEPPVRERRSSALLASLLTGVVGASLGVGLVVAFMRHGATHVSPGPTATASASASAAPPASASASASPSASASASDTTSGLPPTAHFPAGTAKQALDTASKDISHCKRGKVWGIASANVTFGNDGSVAHVAISVPFTGTSTGQCVSDALSTAKVPPFAGKPVVVAYRFFVPIK
jgi:serine/threonine protein kinase